MARTVRIASASFALWKRALSSASAAEERTFFMMENRMTMDPLIGGGESGVSEIIVFFGARMKKQITSYS